MLPIAPRILKPAGLLLLLAALPSVAPAAWPTNPAVNVPVCTQIDSQEYPVSAPDGTGGAYVAWRDTRGFSGIYLQRILADGTPAWNVDGISIGSDFGSSDGHPAIAPDGSGGVIVAWFDWRLGGTIYAQRVNSAGDPLWIMEGLEVGLAADNLRHCAVVADGSGGAIVFWRRFGGSGQVMVAQRLTGNGQFGWPGGAVSVCDAPALGVPVAVSDGLGGAIVTCGATVWNAGTGTYAFDVLAGGVAGGGWLSWQLNVTSAGGDQFGPALASDGAHGAIIAWTDSRLGGDDIFAQRIQPGGILPWGAAGVPVCTASYSQSAASVASDGAGGVVVAWEDVRNGDTDIYAQRLAPSGAQLWATAGVAACQFGGYQGTPRLVSGDEGETLVGWSDMRAGNHSDVYARFVSADGVTRGPDGGVAVSTSTGNKTFMSFVTDGRGGAIAAWQDLRSGWSDIYAQRLRLAGILGPEPAIAGVQDVPNDQGGRLKLSWYACDFDAAPGYGIGSYWIWRSVPPNYAAAALERGALLLDTEAKAAPVAGLTLVTTVEGDKTIFWEYVGSQFAAADAGYSYVVPTTSDSLPGSNPLTLVRVQARAATGSGFWNSAPGSGYSVDNLAPPQPAAFTGNTAGGATALHWLPVPAPDLAGYRLYRGATAGFVPGPSNLVAAQADTGFVDGAPGAHHYKLCAEDIHGNLGPFAVLAPLYTSGVGGALPSAPVLAQNAPNPFNPRTTIRFALPTAGQARLAVYDLAGRLVRSLVAGSLAAGEHEVIWDGCDDDGRAQASGSYLARLEAGGAVRTVRMALVR